MSTTLCGEQGTGGSGFIGLSAEEGGYRFQNLRILSIWEQVARNDSKVDVAP